jgi:outer membrane protein insertion porin family
LTAFKRMVSVLLRGFHASLNKTKIRWLACDFWVGLNCLIALMMIGFPAPCFPQDKPVRVIILPFSVHSPEDLSYLKLELPKVLGNYLHQQGAEIKDHQKISTDLPDAESSKLESIRTFARQVDAEFAIFGSLTRIGDQFSLDASLLNAMSQEPPIHSFVEGQGIENLLGAVKQLADKIGTKLFQRQIIAEVRIAGNKRIEEDAIRRVIKTKLGDIVSAKALSDDLKAIYGMGYFEDIRVEASEGPAGKVVTFQVVEKPTIRKIVISGNNIYDDEEIRNNLNISTGSILNVFKINSNIKAIETFYKEKNYHNVRISYEVQPLENNQADVEIKIEEGQKIRIKTISFDGNAAYDAKKLRKVMKTSEKGFFSWLTSSGELNREDLNQDVTKLAAFYHNNGYIDAKVGEPVIEFSDNWIYITIKIEEGSQFRVGKIDLTGDLVQPKEKLIEQLKIREEEYYNREVVRNDVLLLTDICADVGYAYAEVMPRIDEDRKNLIVNITYAIDKKKKVYFDKILIGGNSKTRDKVIRRQLKVYEKELYNGKGLKGGVRSLYRTDYFEDIKVNTQKGGAEDQMTLKVDVAEKPTGAFSFGAGYSSVENLFAVASVTQRNLFGRGQILQLKGEIGSVTNRYTLSFTEPWLLDIPLSAGIDLYNQFRDYETYERDSVGGRLRFGYPVFDYTRAYLYYTYDVSDISNISEDASDSVFELEGINITNSFTGILNYDSRDRVFNPTEGSEHSISVEYAGFGGDIAFTKYLGETGWYIPLFWETVGFLHGKTGYVEQHPDGLLPDYERFYLGGLNSLRGFGWRDVGPTETNENGVEVEIGGDKFVQLNLEFLIPLVKKAGLMGVLFYDTGNAWAEGDPIDLSNLRESAGFGLRWYSPLGPMRIEYGYILDPEPGEDTNGKWEFGMGAAF